MSPKSIIVAAAILTALTLSLGASRPASAATVYPIFGGDGMLIGGVSHGHWVKATSIARGIGAHHYHVYGMAGKIGYVRGDKPAPGVPCDGTFYTNLTPDVAGEQIATNAPWNVVPRKVTALGVTGKYYGGVVSDYLKAKGIDAPHPSIKQLYSVDLKGDGVNAVIIVADSYDGNPPHDANKGDYSVVLLRQVIHGVVKTTSLAEELHKVAEGIPSQYRFLGCYDLNGDGTLEIVLSGAYYEGSGDEIFDITQKGDMDVLGEACGV